MRLWSGAVIALVLCTARLAFAQCVVTSSRDLGPGTLRSCLEQQDGGPLLVTFSNAVTDGGPIVLDSRLPAMTNVELSGVGASVTIDGWRIRGQTLLTFVQGTAAVSGLELRGIGTDAGEGIGIRLGPSVTRADIILNRIIDTGVGVFIEGVDAGVKVSDNQIVGNTRLGVYATHSGSCSNRSTISRNLIEGNGRGTGDDAILLVQSSCFSITENQLLMNEKCGVRLASSSASVTVLNNRVTANQGGGICVFGNTRESVVAFNVLERNVTTGIVVGGGTLNTLITRNVVRETTPGALSRGWGIHLFATDQGSRVSHNTVWANAGTGIMVEPQATVPPTPVQFRLINNVVGLSGGAGIDAPAEMSSVFGTNWLFANDGGTCVGGCPSDAGGFTSDPLLRADLTPDCSSPLIDRGDGSEVDLPVFLDGGGRLGAALEVGASEVLCAAGGSAAGGSAAGGSAAGGSAAGGAAAGGSVAGGSVAGGSAAGGSAAGGSAAGGSVAGGSVAGGSVAGGSVAGGSVAGGSAAGRSVAGGNVAGGTTAGGSAGEPRSFTVGCSSASQLTVPLALLAVISLVLRRRR
jgi:hypothetical protein